jgi:orotate phosphoribosyltransferase
MKDHGEGGNIIGANPKGDVLIIDDVISAGTAAKESIESIKALGANPNLMLIGLDRQEKGQGTVSARAELENLYGMRVISIINLDALIQFSEKDSGYTEHLSNLKAYRESWGA